jgi:hypothetical protein
VNTINPDYEGLWEVRKERLMLPVITPDKNPESEVFRVWIHLYE